MSCYQNFSIIFLKNPPRDPLKDPLGSPQGTPKDPPKDSPDTKIPESRSIPPKILQEFLSEK